MLARYADIKYCFSFSGLNPLQDLEGALTPAEVSRELGLAALKSRTWQIFKTSATQGAGLEEAMEWLVIDSTPTTQVSPTAMFVYSDLNGSCISVCTMHATYKSLMPAWPGD